MILDCDPIMLVPLLLLTIICSSLAHGHESLVPLNATCASIDAISLDCVDPKDACNTTAQALVEAAAGRTVYLCRDDSVCQDGFCVAKARLGELCDDQVGCFDRRYSVHCESICRGINVYGAGEPSSFKANQECDTSPSSLLLNGGCLLGSQPSLSLACTGSTLTCVPASGSAAGLCSTGVECLAGEYCDLSSSKCVPLSQTSCNFTVPPPVGDGCTADRHCTPNNACTLWFAGGADAPCSINEDCAVDHWCDTATQQCKAATGGGAPCDSPSSICAGGVDKVCECEHGSGVCRSTANEQAYVSKWRALTSCVLENNCFPVVPGGVAGAQSVIGLSFFKGGCYDTRCRQEWLALREDDAICASATFGLTASYLLIVTLMVVAVMG